MLTDVQGSTRKWQEDPKAMSAALARHDQILLETISAHQGRVLKQRGEGDSMFAVFARATEALAAARDIQRLLDAEGRQGSNVIRVRIAIHAGEPYEEAADDYRGPVVNRSARLRALARGGETLVSSTVRELVQDRMPEGILLRDLGLRRLRDLDRPERVYQVIDPDLGMRPIRRFKLGKRTFLTLAVGGLLLSLGLFLIILSQPPVIDLGHHMVPVPAQDATASSLVLAHPPAASIDDVPSTYWAASPTDRKPQLTVTFAKRTNISAIGFASGASGTAPSDQFLAQPRPDKVHLVFSDGTTADLILLDQSKVQFFPVTTTLITWVRIEVISVFPSAPGPALSSVAITEVEFQTDPNSNYYQTAVSQASG
jgi:class 3 adenylate cyclase